MRQGKLREVALAALALAVVPAAASAASFEGQHPSANGRCTVTAPAAPATATAGATVLVFGRLRCLGGTTTAGKTVRLFAEQAGGTAFTQVASTSTAQQGFYELTVTDVSSSARFFVRAHGASSGLHGVRIAAQVTLSGPPEGSQILTGRANRVTFTGTVLPANAGARVILQRQSSPAGNNWHRIGVGTVQTDGTFSISIRSSSRAPRARPRPRAALAKRATRASACWFAARVATSPARRTYSSMRSPRRRTRR